MKILLPLLLILISCSSTKEKSRTKEGPVVKNEVFKKPKALKNSEVPDYYTANIPGISPALQDETLDRYSKDELSKVNTQADPLMDISVRCAKGDFEGAFSVASKSFHQYQKVASYWNQIANCHLNQGSHRKALLFYNKALEVSPNYVPALNNIGVMYSRQGQDQKALIAFERASKQSKFSKTPRYNLARLYLTYGLVESALPLFQGLLEQTPQDVDLLNANASAYYFMSDYNRALAYYQRIPQGAWGQPEIGLNLAMTLNKVGRSKDAVQVYKNISRPGQAGLKQYYSIVGKQLGDIE